MITTRLRNLLTAVVCLLAGVSAQAQFSGSATQYPTTDYSASPIAFKLSDVAAALDTDAATLGAALSEYIEAEAPAALLFAQQTDGTESSTPTADANGFWMDAEGNNVGYGDASVFYASPSVDTEADEFVFNCGQMPGVMEAGQTAKGSIKLKYNAKEVTFALELNVIAKPVYNIPEPTLVEKELNIVGEATVTAEQYPRGGYDSDPIQVELPDVVAKLGLPSADILVDALDQILYTTLYNTGDVEQGGGMKKDSLTNTPTGEGVGYWYRPVQDENGELSGEASAAGWGSDDKFYVNNLTFDASNNVLSGVLGQYPGSCKDNEEWYANVYLVYGQNAYRVKITLKVLEKEQGNGLDSYTKVGEDAVTVEQAPDNDYKFTAIHPNMDAIAEALGCEVSSIGFYALDDKDNFAGSTAGNQGFWFSLAGTVTSWGATAAFFVENPTANDFSTLNVGQYPNVFKVGDEASANVYFINGSNYYQYTVNLKIIEKEQVEHNFESVATRTFNLQSLLDNNYTAMNLASISTADVEELIGTTDPTLYGLNNDSIAAIEGSIYSNAYSCTPHPGFWLAKDGTVSKWGSESPVGICYGSDGTFTFFQFPNANSIGDVFKTTLFLVNEETEKMITLNISLAFVETLEEKEIVGSENIYLPVSSDEHVLPIDLAPAAEALGVTVDDLLSSDNYYLRGLKSDGVYGEGQNGENGLSFTPDGGYDGWGDIFFTLAKGTNGPELIIASNNDVADDYSVSAQFCFEVDNKQYVYYARLVSEAIYAGISHITADRANAGLIYDLSGRQVSQPTRGLYIQNGRKVVVK